MPSGKHGHPEREDRRGRSYKCAPGEFRAREKRPQLGAKWPSSDLSRRDLASRSSQEKAPGPEAQHRAAPLSREGLAAAAPQSGSWLLRYRS